MGWHSNCNGVLPVQARIAGGESGTAVQEWRCRNGAVAPARALLVLFFSLAAAQAGPRA